MRGSAAKWTVGLLLALGGPLGAARAGGLDGEWTRDDGKKYLFADRCGLVKGASELGCRIAVTEMEDLLSLAMTYTRVSDEKGFIRTYAHPTTSFDMTRIPDSIDFVFEWVDLDEQGAVASRGEETHRMRRTRGITNAEVERLSGELAHEVTADTYLDPASPVFSLDDALAQIDAALASDAGKDDARLLARRKAIAARLRKESKQRPADVTAESNPSPEPVAVVAPAPAPAAAAVTSLTDDEKHRLVQAGITIVGATRDASIMQTIGQKIGTVDAQGTPTAAAGQFGEAHRAWMQGHADAVKELADAAIARAYLETFGIRTPSRA